MDGLYKIKWINFIIIIVLCILLFATMYQHLPPIKYIVDNFEVVWWILFSILVCSIVAPISLTYFSEKEIKEIYQKLESDSSEFLKKYNQYLVEKLEKQRWKSDNGDGNI